MSAIEKVAVIGAGVMGAGIAAHIANAGVPVVLLDIVPEGASDRDAIAAGAIENLIKSDPAALMHKRNAKRITPGNIDDDLDRLADCDWIIEAVIERADIKRLALRKARGGPQGRVDRFLEHLDHPLGHADRGHAGAICPRFADHPFLQPTALHAIARVGRGT